MFFSIGVLLHIQIWSFPFNTGGTWALAQLGSLMRDAGHKVTVTLPGESISGGVDVIIAPEIALEKLCTVRGPVRVLWWLSVDHAYWHPRRDQLYDQIGPRMLDLVDAIARRRLNALLRDSGQRDILHAVQSEYARSHIRRVLDVEPLMLTDFLTDLDTLAAPAELQMRARCVAYNPAKGLPTTQRAIRALDGIATFQPLQALTHAETIELLKGCLIYLDLGEHPGRDRLPREAAVAGCVVLVGKRGAAANNIDIPIPDEYKLPVPWRFKKADPVVRRICDVIADPVAHQAPMKHIVQTVLQQESVFRKEVGGLLAELRRRLQMQ